MNFTVPIYQTRTLNRLKWTTIGLGPYNEVLLGKSPLKLRRQLIDTLKQKLLTLGPRDVARFWPALGVELRRPRLEIQLRGARRKRLAGLYPLAVLPRWVSEERMVYVVTHPARQFEWFIVEREEEIAETAAAMFGRCWAGLEDEALSQLVCHRKDLLRSIAFSAQPKTLLDQLPDHGTWSDLVPESEKQRPARGMELIPKLGTNLTMRAVSDALPLGRPRAAIRAQLSRLLTGKSKASTLLVGPPRAGKTTVINRLVYDLAMAENFEAHKNLDRLHNVWAISGRRIIAGMSHLGEWEQRCSELALEAKRNRVILLIDDLVEFAHLGRTRDSARSFADFFRGPLQRREMLVLGECTPEALVRMEREAPAFAACFTQVSCPETSESETYEILFHEMREMERAPHVVVDPRVLRSLVDLGGSLFPAAAFPGKAVDLLKEMARKSEDGDVGPWVAISTIADRTGLPHEFLRDQASPPITQIQRDLEQRIMGQPAAVAAAADLLLTIRAGLTDPGRPYGVMLFTGPTGTGKTELAKTIAEQLFSDRRRLVRLDMNEYGGWDAAARLIGDRFHPNGTLTQPILDQAFSVVLLDEIEKAHPSALNLLLQLFDDGRLTDAAGRTADFTNTVVIMTSNLGAKEKPAIGFGAPGLQGREVAEAVKAFFPPELFNRIDRVVPFLPLTKDAALQIVRKEMLNLAGRRGLVERTVFVEFSDAVVSRAVEAGFDPALGARPLKRYLEDNVGTLLTERLVQSGDATMQIFRIFAQREGGRFFVHANPLFEAEPLDRSYEIQSLLDANVAELQSALDAAMASIGRVVDEGVIERLGERIADRFSSYAAGDRAAGEMAYHLDDLRARIEKLREKLQRAAERTEADLDLLEAERFTYQPAGPDGRRTRAFDPRAMTPDAEPITRARVLAWLAEAQFLLRAQSLVEDPAQHSVALEFLAVGRSVHGLGLLGHLFRFYIDRGARVESVSAMTPKELRVGDALPHGTRHAVVHFSGLCVRDLLQHEVGSHVWRSVHSGTELIRVRTLPRNIDGPAHLKEHAALREHFEAELEAGRTDVDDPDRLLPAVRTITFDPPRGGARAPADLEDYVLGFSTTVPSQIVTDAIKTSWLLRMSRSLGSGTNDDGD